jgi:hypothetical protein
MARSRYLSTICLRLCCIADLNAASLASSLYSSFGKIGRVFPHLALCHGLENFILGIQAVFVFLIDPSHDPVHVVMGRSALGAVGLVNHHGKVLFPQITDTVKNKGKFLYGGDDDLFALLQGRF